MYQILIGIIALAGMLAALVGAAACGGVNAPPPPPPAPTVTAVDPIRCLYVPMGEFRESRRIDRDYWGQRTRRAEYIWGEPDGYVYGQPAWLWPRDESLEESLREGRVDGPFGCEEEWDPSDPHSSHQTNRRLKR